LDGKCIDDNYDVSHVTGGPSVQSLIDTTAKAWNVNVIQQVFSPEITRRILDTPLIDQVTDDRLVWKAERNGYYSVKSAYRLVSFTAGRLLAGYMAVKSSTKD
jgi:hypothetical protein